jgi:hypothetical protein
LKSTAALQLEILMTSRRTAALLSIVSIAISLGCASNPAIYPGPRRPAEEVATILAGRGLTFLKINTRELGETEYELLPSTYTLQFQAIVRLEELGGELGRFMEGRRRDLLCKVTLKAVAGHTYEFSRDAPKNMGRDRNVEGTTTRHAIEVYITDTTEGGESWAVGDKCHWR